MNRGALWAAAVLAGTSVMVGAAAQPSGRGSRAEDALRQLQRPKAPTNSPVEVRAKQNEIVVSDARGKKLLEARAAEMLGTFQSGKGVQGPLNFKTAKCRLFEKGRPQWDMQSPDAYWDGDRLVARRDAKATTADGELHLTAGRTEWTAKDGTVDAMRATLESRKNGAFAFRAGGPRARVVGPVITLAEGASGENAEGETMQAGHLVWRRDTGGIEARGGVVLKLTDATVTGRRLSCSTRLKTGRMEGGTRLVITPRPGTQLIPSPARRGRGN